MTVISSLASGRGQDAAGSASSATPAARRASPRDSPVTWLYVTYPGTGPCFALICDGGRVVTCPPAARWARGEETAKVVSYYRRRGIKVEDFRS